MNNIEKVIYINLDHRTDRKEEVETELLKVFPTEKIERFSGIYEKTKGHIGCTKSHITVLEMAIANNWRNYLVVEDDMIWDNFEKNSSILNDLFYKNPDVIVFGGTSIIYDKKTYKLNRSCCTTSYLVFNHYYKTLLANFKEGLNLLDSHYSHITPFAIDQYWHKLQQKDNWYVIYPTLCLQREGFSDINNAITPTKYGTLYTTFFGFRR